MIVGGGRIAYYLAKFLEESGMRIKIIESSHERCLTLSELLPEALIIHGDGSDESLLYSENLQEMGAFVSLTGHDEDNLMLALLAKQAGVPKVIAKISRNNYVNLIKSLGIDSIVNPGQITTNLILMFVRGLKNALGNPIKSLYRIVNNQAEALEFTINEPAKFLGIPLKHLKISKDILVAVIVRKNEIIIPHGNDSIKRGDSVILIAKNRQIFDLNEIISTEGSVD
ncbi:NAD-binding protein [Thermoclostridium stercorarium]|nr:NAD-binding protein [Thermoclostridium stercorarium]